MKLSEWQGGVPKENGVYQIDVPEHRDNIFTGIYYSRFKRGKWDVGMIYLEEKLNCSTHKPYQLNNNLQNPRKWRGLVDE